MNRYERMNQERKIVDVRKRVAAYCRVSQEIRSTASIIRVTSKNTASV